ncbi:MAG: hypothetical protein J6K99_07180 [Peptococcaceae bacterium]|nr:hypothetical protein [Peptococcaceae bacterium]
MADKTIRCVDCEYCRDFRPLGNTRGSFYCKHENQKYIYDFCKWHGFQKQPGFIGFGKSFENKPTIKTSPAWCPKKAEGV